MKRKFFGKIAPLAALVHALTYATLVTSPIVRAGNLQTESATDEPYLNGQPTYVISESEYKDLLVYIEGARETLLQTIKEARRLTGERLQARLMSGIDSALSQSGVKSDLLLFRYLLENASTLNGIYMDATADAPRMRADAEVVASSAILLTSILKALEYHKERDLPRVGSPRIVTPDWVSFAIDEITLSLRVADLAPTEESKKEITERTLGWVARALNSDPNRRSHAKQVVSLARMQQELRNGTRSVTEAQALLVEVRAQLNGGETPNEPRTRNHPAATATTSTATETRRERPIFPLIKLDSDLVNGLLLGQSQSGMTTLDVHAGVGASITNDPRTRKGATFVEVFAAANLISSLAPYHAPLPELAEATADASVSGSFQGQGLTGLESRLSVGAGAMLFLAPWAAIEINQYPALAEFLVRVGIAPTAVFRLGGTNYLMVRVVIGGWVTNYGQGQTLDQAFAAASNPYTEAYGGEVLFKLSKFVVKANYSYDEIKGHMHTDKRDGVEAAIGIPLSLIFPNDRIYINGRFIKYTRTDAPGAVVLKSGIFYEVQF